MKVQKIGMITVIASIVALAFGAPAAAHVVVKPAEVMTAGFYTFTVGVPNEKEVPVSEVKLLIPNGVRHVSPTQKAGWEISLEKEGEGTAQKVTSITWRGGTIAVDFRDDFLFSAQTPDGATQLEWRAYQTYADGTTVAWDRAAEGGHGGDDNTGPFSVTKVVAEDPNKASSLKEAEQKADEATSAAQTAFYVGVAGVVVGLIGIFLGSRKR